MKVLVIGGTGYIGTAVVERLRAAGHRPVVLARKPDRAPEGVPVRTGDLTDTDRLRKVLTPDIDAVVHAATPTGNWDIDLAALAVMTDALSGRMLVYLSGVWVLGATTDAVDESAPADPIEIVSGRPRLEDHVLNATEVRGVVIRPGIVHGAGGGIPGMMIDWARAARTGRYVGEPTVRWPMVHRDDLADLVVLAVDRAPAGTVLHAVAEPGVAVKELAVAADLAAGGRGAAQAWDEHDAASELGGPFAGALALHQEVTANVAGELGWTPSHVDAVRELSETAR
jgi:nucleoside-diphosphate-sugar epimerase